MTRRGVYWVRGEAIPPAHFCHCERSEAIPPLAAGDRFGKKRLAMTREGCHYEQPQGVWQSHLATFVIASAVKQPYSLQQGIASVVPPSQ